MFGGNKGDEISKKKMEGDGNPEHGVCDKKEGTTR